MADKKTKGEDSPFILRTTLTPPPETKRGYATHIYANTHKIKKIDYMIYANGRTVVMRNLANPSEAKTFTEHKAKVNVAQFSPNGEWVASGDSEGQVLVWSFETGIVKTTVPVGKAVNDLSWDPEGKRIVAVGDGAEAKARVFSWDSGNNVGTIDYHSQPILSVSYKTSRPFKIVTGSEDLLVNLYEGPPFKYVKSQNNKHTRYPNVVRFAPDGNTYLSAGSDQKLYVYSSDKGEIIKEIEHKDGHKGAIYSFAWSPDSKRIVTVSADKTAKIWDVDSGAVTKTFTFPASGGPSHDDMLAGCLWHTGPSGTYCVVLANSGALYYLDTEAGTIKQTLHGHRDNIMDISLDRKNSRAFACDLIGKVGVWDLKSLSCQWLGGKGHEKTVVGCAINADGSILATVGLDDKLRLNKVKEAKDYQFSTDAIGLGGKPSAVACGNKSPGLVAVVLAQKKIVIVRDGRIASSTDTSFEPTSVAISPDDSELAVAGKGGKIVFYALAGDTPKEKSSPEGAALNLNSVRYSADGKLVVVTDSDRRISIFDSSKKNVIPTNWRYHGANVPDGAFSPSGALMVTCSMDESLIVWGDLKGFDPLVRKRADMVHAQGVMRCAFIDDKTVITMGFDRCIKIWEIKA